MPVLSKEFKLLAASATWPPSPQRSQAIRASVQEVDWNAFAAISHRHRLAGFAHQGLKLAGLESPERLAKQAKAIAISGLRHSVETWRLQQAASEAGLPVIFMKGAALAQEVYSSVHLRHSKDIDVLVASKDIEAAWVLLEREGYQRVRPHPGASNAQLRLFMRLSKDSVFHHPAKKIEVELHWRLVEAQGTELQGALRQVELPNLGPITTLNPEALFIYLCVHGGGHAWMRLKWLADIAALLGASPDAPETYWSAATAAGEEVAVETAMRLSGLLFGSALPAGLNRRARLRVRLLMALSLKAMAAAGGWAEPNQTLLGRFAEPLASLILASNWRQRLHGVHVMLVPAEDVLIMGLPRGLAFLYPVLRLPLWVWKNGFLRTRTRKSQSTKMSPSSRTTRLQ